jgi:hypothetical protein
MTLATKAKVSIMRLLALFPAEQSICNPHPSQKISRQNSCRLYEFGLRAEEFGQAIFV